MDKLLTVHEIRDKVKAAEARLSNHGGQADVEKVLEGLREVIPSLDTHVEIFDSIAEDGDEAVEAASLAAADAGKTT